MLSYILDKIQLAVPVCLPPACLISRGSFVDILCKFGRIQGSSHEADKAIAENTAFQKGRHGYNEFVWGLLEKLESHAPFQKGDYYCLYGFGSFIAVRCRCLGRV
jgi:hypothetical protein